MNPVHANKELSNKTLDKTSGQLVTTPTKLIYRFYDVIYSISIWTCIFFVVLTNMILFLAIKQMRLRPNVLKNPARRVGRGLPSVVRRAGGLCQSEALYRALTEQNKSVLQGSSSGQYSYYIVNNGNGTYLHLYFFIHIYLHLHNITSNSKYKYYNMSYDINVFITFQP